MILAETSGFCYGVDRAVNMAYALADKGYKCCTLGPLIHNTDVTSDLCRKGIRIIERPEEAEKGEKVIIRAHGVASEIYDILNERGTEISDATCPFVKKIHNIVSENSLPDTVTLIAGDPVHPEVIGIKSYCKGSSFVFNSSDELEKILKPNNCFSGKKVIAVSQTTFSKDEWKKCSKILNLHCTNLILFDTICGATRKRQEEAEQLSKQCDAMIVIGGRHSSNTAKLQSLCSANCNTFLVERAEELKNIDFSTYARVGVTAGASTPAGVIKEVLLAMSEFNENVNNQVEEVPSVEQSFDAMLEESLANMSTDKHVKGMVMAITPTDIQVDIGRKHAGFVPIEEYSANPNADPSKELKIGDEIDLIIMKTNDEAGQVVLSKKLYDVRQSWTELVDGKEDGRIFEGTVTNVVKGGVLAVTANGARVFIPASQTTVRKDGDLESLLKQDVKFVVIDVTEKDGKKRAVGSIRKVVAGEKAAAEEAFWAAAEEGKQYTGIVKSLTNYGAFVDIGGVDGMVHISEMSWRRIKHPSEVLEVGQEIEVFIKSLDAENKKISLGYKKDEDNPWVILKKNYPVDSVVEAEIVGVTKFGAFARVIPGIDGLIHISQIANRRIEKAEDELAIGQKVQCKITEIDFDKKRVSLSIRALLADEEEVTEEAEEAVEEAEEAVEEAEEAVEATAEDAE